MSYQIPPMNWLRAFESAARHSSFTLAAEELHLSQPAVSYQVRSLEAHLDARLFERQARSVELTDAGRAYLPTVREAFTQLSVATGSIFGAVGTRCVTVRCTATFANAWLAPRLAEFRRANPNIEVRLSTAVWADAIGDGQVDLDIRYGDGRWGGYSIALLQSEPSVPVCSPVVLATIDDPGDVSSFASLELIQITGCESRWDSWFRSGGVEDPPQGHSVHVDNSAAALAVAASGYGVALVLTSFAEPYLRRGDLVRPNSHYVVSDQAHYVLTPAARESERPEVVLFRDWLLQQNTGDRA